MDGTAISVEGVCKSFLLPHERRNTFKEYFLHPLRRVEMDRQHALRDVTFAVDRGEFFGIMGPNGSGKSTLLKIIAGIYRADRGGIRVRGVMSPFIELGVGFNPELSARDNIRISATLLGLDRCELADRFGAIVEFSELERFLDLKLKNFSSGMQVRLAYSIAIQIPFDVLLLDEVLAVGDQSFQEKCFATFDHFREIGKTVVFVSHDLGSIVRFCDRAMLLEHGAIQALGPAIEVADLYLKKLTSPVAVAS